MVRRRLPSLGSATHAAAFAMSSALRPVICAASALTEIAAKGWQDKAFIAASTNDFDQVLAANNTSLA
jgi:hypothetical protein